MKNRRLFFFTASFPFDNRESFIETEIIYLSKFFKEIVIIPLYGDKEVYRTVPENCLVIDPIISNKLQHYVLGLFGIKSFKYFGKYLFSKKVFANMRSLKTFVIAFCTTNVLLKSKSLIKLINSVDSESILYFYWGVGSTYLIPYLRHGFGRRVVRFHGEWDLYEEGSSGGFSPLREEIVSKINTAVFISKIGLDYFKTKYPLVNTEMKVSYLGTSDYGVSSKSKDGVFRLLSCSNIVPLKRVLLIYESLQLIENTEIEWTHIGDGIEFEKLKEKSKSSKSNVKVILLGRLLNVEVINYYKHNNIDAFINISTIEGLPVSLMEAISFNIPVIGTNVGATSEIVNSDTGILLPWNSTKKEISDAITNIQQLDLTPRNHWLKMFNAETNYTGFIKDILIN